MGREEYKAYDLIAVRAGFQAGVLTMDSPEASALSDADVSAMAQKAVENEEARKNRDERVMDFERRLRERSYSGEDVLAWFRATYGPIGRSSIFRARAALRAYATGVEEIAKQAQAIIDLGKESGADAVNQAIFERMGQLMFQMLMEINAGKLSGEYGGKINLNKFFSLVDAFGNLRKRDAGAKKDAAVVDLANEKRKQLEQAKAKVQQTPVPAGGFTKEDVYQMIDDVMKGVA
jgi:hypothetical protein